MNTKKRLLDIKCDFEKRRSRSQQERERERGRQRGGGREGVGRESTEFGLERMSMFNRIAATRRRAKQRVFESAAGSDNLPISDLTPHRANIEKLVSLERRMLAVCRSAEAIKAANDTFTKGVETLLSDVGNRGKTAPFASEDVDGASTAGSTPRTAASTPRSDSGSEVAGEENSLLKDAAVSGSPRNDGDEEEDEMTRAVGVLRATAKDCKTSVAHYRSKFQALDEARLDFDAYRRKVARFDKSVMEQMEKMEQEGLNPGGRNAESKDAKEAKKELDGLYKEQQDKQRKLASATEVFDMKCEIFQDEITNDYDHLKLAVRDAVLLFGAAQKAYAGVIGERVIEGLAPNAGAAAGDAGVAEATTEANGQGAADGNATSGGLAEPQKESESEWGAAAAPISDIQTATTLSQQSLKIAREHLIQDSPGRLVSDMERVILTPAATPVVPSQETKTEFNHSPLPDPEPELQWGQDSFSSPSLGLAGGAAWGDKETTAGYGTANPFLS